jgi:hypothetical protein
LHGFHFILKPKYIFEDNWLSKYPEEANCDLRAWSITVRIRQLTGRPRLKWETVQKYLEQMVNEQMIFRYEDPGGIITYSKNPIIREKVLF